MDYNLSDLQLYGAEDYEELDIILDALDKASEAEANEDAAK